LQSALNLTLPMSEEFFYCFYLFFCLFLWKKIGGVAVCLKLDIGNVRGFFYCFSCLFLFGKNRWSCSLAWTWHCQCRRSFLLFLFVFLFVSLEKIGGVAVCLKLDICNVRGFFLLFFLFVSFWELQSGLNLTLAMSEEWAALSPLRLPAATNATSCLICTHNDNTHK